MGAPRAALIAMTLAVCGALIGSGLAQIVAARVLVFARMPPLRLPPVELARPAPAAMDRMFPPEPPDGPPPPPPDGPCDPAWRLVGAAVFRDAPERSLAAVHTPSGGVVLRASEARDAWTLVAVEPDRVTVRDADGRECEVSMHPDELSP